MATLNDITGLSGDATQTYFVDNFVIVEPLNGPTTLAEIMDRFPDQVYQKGTDTHLYRLLQALCGDAGAGLAKKQAYAARLKYEASFLSFKVLDQIYAAQFHFHRLRSETYADVNTDDALSDENWDRAEAADARYYHRIQQFWTGTRSGNSPEGIQFVAEAGCGLECEIVEHYKYIYDAYSDDPLGLEPQGVSDSTNEFVVIPRFDPAANWHYIPDVLPSYNFQPPLLAEPGNGRITTLNVGDFLLRTAPVYVYDLPVLLPHIERNTIDLLDRIRPVDTFCTFRLEDIFQSVAHLGNPTASSIRNDVTRYVNGNPDVNWPIIEPAINSFIRPDTETAAGSFADASTRTPATFYTIEPNAINAFTDEALQDPDYGTPEFYANADDGIAPIDSYRSEYAGGLPTSFIKTFPQYSVTPRDVFSASSALAVNNTPLVITGSMTL